MAKQKGTIGDKIVVTVSDIPEKYYSPKKELIGTLGILVVG
jgi:hypothetical protein